MIKKLIIFFLIPLIFSCNLFEANPSIEITSHSGNKSTIGHVLPGMEVHFYLSSTENVDDSSKTRWYIDGVQSDQVGDTYTFLETTPGEYNIVAKVISSENSIMQSKEATDSFKVVVTDKFNQVSTSGLPNDLTKTDSIDFYTSSYASGDRIVIHSSPDTVYFSIDGGSTFDKLTLSDNNVDIHLIPEGDFILLTTPIDRYDFTTPIKLYNTTDSTPTTYKSLKDLGYNNGRLSTVNTHGTKIYFTIATYPGYDIHMYNTFSDLGTTWNLPTDYYPDMNGLYFDLGIPNQICSSNKKILTLNIDGTITELGKIGSFDFLSEMGFTEVRYINGVNLVVNNSGQYLMFKEGNWQEINKPDSIYFYETGYMLTSDTNNYNLKLKNTLTDSEIQIEDSYYKAITTWQHSPLRYMTSGSYIFYITDKSVNFYIFNP